MYLSRTIKNGDYLDGWRMEHGDWLKVSNGAIAMDISVGYKAELKVLSGGIVGNVSVSSKGDASFSGAEIYGVRADEGSYVNFKGCIIENLSADYCAFHLTESEVYGTISISGISADMDATLFDGTITLYDADITTSASVFYGELNLNYSEVTVEFADLTNLSLADSVFEVDEVYVEGEITIDNSVLSGGILEVEGNVNINDFGTLDFDEASVRGNVTLTNAYMFTGNTVISGTLSLNNRASAYVSNCILNSAAVNSRSYLMINGGVRVDRLSIGTSSLVDLNDTIVYGAGVGSKSLLYASNAEIFGLQVSQTASATLYNKASATAATILAGGSAIISSGGVLTGETSSGSFLTVKAGGAMRGVYVSSGTAINGFNVTYARGYTVSGAKYTATYYLQNGGAGWGTEIPKAPNSTDHYFNYDNDGKEGLVIVSAFVAGFESGAIYSGQIANEITVSYGGQAHVSSGAYMSSVDIENHGSLYISRGGSAADVSIVSGGQMTVYKDAADVKDITVASGATLNNSGVINTARANRGAIVNIGANGAINNANMNSGAIINISSGGAINGISATTNTNMVGIHFSGAAVNGNGILSGGQTADNIIVNSGGTLAVLKGAEITNANANGGVIALAGNLSNGQINANGQINVASGGKAENIVINDGTMNVISGGSAKTVAVSGGNLNVSDAKASDIDIIAGTVTVADGGELEDVVNSGGSFNVLSGGKFDSANLIGGETTVHSGAETGAVTMTGGILNQNADAVINGFTFDADYTHSGSLFFSGASVNAGANAQLNSGDRAADVQVLNNGTMTINSGASASATKVNAGGQLNIFGDAADTVISKNGIVTVGENGYAAATTIKQGGILAAANGGVIADTTVNVADAVKILSGGSALNTQINGAGATIDVFSGGTLIGGQVINGGAANVSGGVISGFTADNGSINLLSGAQANDNTVKLNGKMNVDSGAVASNTTILSAGLMTVLDGGTAVQTTVNSRGNLVVSHGGIISGLNAKDGAIINGLTIKHDQTQEKFLLDDAVVSCHTTAFLYDNQSANRAHIQSDAVLNIYSGGVANNAIISQGGIRVSGGLVNNAVLQENAMILARSGAVINDTDVQWGEIFVYDATANRTVIKSFGTAYVNDGVLNDTTVANGSVIGSQESEIHKIILRGGSVFTRGYIDDATVIAGEMSATDNAVVVDTVLSGGTLKLTGNANHSGTMYIADGASVIAAAGTVIDFGVAGRTTADNYIINNISLITGAPAYTITVDVFQGAGIYKLAQGAAAFNTAVSVKNTDGKSMLNLSVNGSKLYYEGMLYALNQASGNLTLKITEQERSSISANGVSQIVAWDANNGTVGMVQTTNLYTGAEWKGIWDWRGCCGTGSVCCVDKWRVVGTGRFKGTAVDTDGILLYNNENNTFAAWSNISDPSYGYISLCHVEANFSVKSIGNFDNNSFDDVIIYDEKGSFGIVIDGTTYHDIWHVDDPAANNIELIGAGYFGNPNGTESLLVKNTSDNNYYFWHNNDTTFATWAWSQDNNIAGKAEDGWKIVAIGDFQGDFVDDIIVWQESTGYMFAWEDGNSQNQRWVGALDANGWEVAAVGDYNGDGKEDLLLRELVTGWGGLGYWGAANADNWVDLNARVENNDVSNFTVIA